MVKMLKIGQSAAKHPPLIKIEIIMGERSETKWEWALFTFNVFKA
jgi:hypothetical protein